MRRNDRETEIRMMTMEEYLKKRQVVRQPETVWEGWLSYYIIDELIIVLIILIF